MLQLHLQPESHIPLYVQLRDQLRALVHSGDLRPCPLEASELVLRNLRRRNRKHVRRLTPSLTSCAGRRPSSWATIQSGNGKS